MDENCILEKLEKSKSLIWVWNLDSCTNVFEKGEVFSLMICPQKILVIFLGNVQNLNLSKI